MQAGRSALSSMIRPLMMMATGAAPVPFLWRGPCCEEDHASVDRVVLSRLGPLGRVGGHRRAAALKLRQPALRGRGIMSRECVLRTALFCSLVLSHTRTAPNSVMASSREGERASQGALLWTAGLFAGGVSHMASSPVWRAHQWRLQQAGAA